MAAYDSKTISREKAKELGLKRYFTGEKCIRGHSDDRYVSNNYCLSCKKEKEKIWLENNREYRLKQGLEYARKNRKRMSDYSRQWRRNNPEKASAINRRWRENNPEKARLNDMKKRRRKVGGDSAKIIGAWLRSQVKQCYWCGISCAESFHIDHVVPISKGGPHRVENMVVSCPDCNQKKMTKMPEDWNKELGRLI